MLWIIFTALEENLLKHYSWSKTCKNSYATHRVCNREQGHTATMSVSGLQPGGFTRRCWRACGWVLRAERRRAEPGREFPAQRPAAPHSEPCSASRPGYTSSSPGSAATTYWRWDDCTERFRHETAFPNSSKKKSTLEMTVTVEIRNTEGGWSVTWSLTRVMLKWKCWKES